MERGFLSSPEFKIAAALAVLVLVGGAIALAGAVSGRLGVRESHCREAAPAGTVIPTTPTDATETWVGHAERRITHVLDASKFAGGSVSLCTHVGDVILRPSPDSNARLVATISASGPGDDELVKGASVEVAFASFGGRLEVFARQANVPQWRSFFSGRSASVDLVLELPRSGSYDVKATTDVGDAEVTGLIVRAVSIHTDVGDARAFSLDAIGNVSVVTDVGDVEMTLASVTTGRLDVKTDVGSISLRLPARVDVGYDVTASADVGNVEVTLGDEDSGHARASSEGPSERVSARSSNYASKPTRLAVTAITDVGDVVVRATREA